MVAGGNVNLDVMWVLEGPVGPPRSDPVGSGPGWGSISVLPALPVTLSAALSQAAQQPASLQARHKGYPTTLACPFPDRMSASHCRAGTPPWKLMFRNYHTAGYWHIWGPLGMVELSPGSRAG